MVQVDLVDALEDRIRIIIILNSLVAVSAQLLVLALWPLASGNDEA